MTTPTFTATPAPRQHPHTPGIDASGARPAPAVDLAAVLVDNTGAADVMPGVYSLAWPETNETFASVSFPTELWNVTASRATFDDALTAAGFGTLPDAPAGKLGLMDLVHEPLIDSIIRSISPGLPGIESKVRAHRYPLHGSAAGIGMLLDHLARTTPDPTVCVLEGDYEGYAAQAGHHGVNIRVVAVDDAFDSDGNTWFVSTPSGINGAPVDETFLERLCNRNRVVVDVAYHGLAGPGPTRIPATAWAVLWSLSKPYGLFWRRVGLLVCAGEIDGAYGTRWFKDPERLWQAAHTVREHAAHSMAAKYRWLQLAAVDELRSRGLPITPAPVVLLGTVNESDCSRALWTLLAPYVRVPASGVARVTLTPLMEKLLAWHEASVVGIWTPPPAATTST